jgi:ATP phosphoribosyltransferase
MSAESTIRLALPGKGALEAATSTFLAECGMKVNRKNPRQYLARINSMPDLEVVFQRAADIPALVQDGDAAFGITGYDILAEHRGYGSDEEEEERDDEDLLVLKRDLEYGHCRLAVAVPETWIDVNTMADLWHLAGYYQAHKRRELRIATKYPLLTGRFLRRHGITRCRLVSPHGALEAAPLTDTADLIVDLTETGTTLRENHLKLLDDGVVLHSQACLIVNARLLREDERTLRQAEIMLELIEARMAARNRSLLTASLLCESQEDIQRHVKGLNQRLRGLQTDVELRITSLEAATPWSGAEGHRWYTLSGVVGIRGEAASRLLELVAVLRSAGATDITITPLTYRFRAESPGIHTLRERLQRKG